MAAMTCRIDVEIFFRGIWGIPVQRAINSVEVETCMLVSLRITHRERLNGLTARGLTHLNVMDGMASLIKHLREVVCRVPRRLFDRNKKKKDNNSKASLAWHVPADQQHAAMESLRTYGFVVLKGVVAKSEVARFRAQAVAPALRAAGRSIEDENTWPGGDGEMVKAATPDPNYGDWYPIPLSTPDGRWPAFFDSPSLNNFLNHIHGGAANWQWNDGAAHGCGWIHVRYPVARTMTRPTGWHIDGQNEGYSLGTIRSVVCLPLVTPIEEGGGGTALAIGSHKHVAQMLSQIENGEVNNVKVTQLASFLAKTCEIAEATGDEGDVLVMHPFLVHSASRAMRGHPVRISFNLATKWTAPVEKVRRSRASWC